MANYTSSKSADALIPDVLCKEITNQWLHVPQVYAIILETTDQYFVDYNLAISCVVLMKMPVVKDIRHETKKAAVV